MSSTLDSGPWSRVYALGMPNVLDIPARSGAAIACDMSGAPDTPEERLSAYRSLFEHALVGRERGAYVVVFRFRADPATRAAVELLVRREAECCPFVDYRVEASGDELRWTTTNPVRGDVRIDAILGEFYALAGHARSAIAG